MGRVSKRRERRELKVTIPDPFPAQISELKIQDSYEETQHWSRRLWLYGSSAFECVSDRQPVFRSEISTGAQGRCRAGSGEDKTVRAQVGISVALHGLETAGRRSGS